MTTSFVPWYLLSEANLHAPKASGVFQIKISQGLVDYPSGKSAMIHYAGASDLCAAISAVAEDRQGSEFLCRHQATQDPAKLLEFVLGQFQRRFGKSPMWI